MALLGSGIAGEVGLRLLLWPIGSNVVIRTACCTVGIALPVYSTFKAIENKDHIDQEKWLLYWAAYGSFSLVEVFSDKILSWLPFYYHMKLAFLVWLQFPSSDGSRHLYSRHLRPFFLKHQAKLDQFLGSISNEIVKFVSTHQGEILFLKVLLGRCVITANQMIADLIRPGRPRQLTGAEGPNASMRRQNRDQGADHDD